MSTRAMTFAPLLALLLAAAPATRPAVATTPPSATKPATTRAAPARPATLATTRPAATRPATADVGDAFPPFHMNRTDGKLVTNESLMGKPAVVIFGSWSAPSFRDQLPRVADLAARYGGRVNWLIVYTREQWPATGPSTPGPERNSDDKIAIAAAATDAERLAAAKQVVEKLKLHLEVAPDAIDDRLTRGANAFPNAAFVLDPRGTVVARLEWAEPFALKRHLDQLLAAR